MAHTSQWCSSPKLHLGSLRANETDCEWLFKILSLKNTKGEEIY
jgi:hypothetical protein